MATTVTITITVGNVGAAAIGQNAATRIANDAASQVTNAIGGLADQATATVTVA